jgi:hypothetical protein
MLGTSVIPLPPQTERKMTRNNPVIVQVLMVDKFFPSVINRIGSRMTAMEIRKPGTNAFQYNSDARARMPAIKK